MPDGDFGLFLGNTSGRPLSATDADEHEVEIVVLRDGEELSYLLPLANVTVLERRSTERSEPELAQILWQMQQQMLRQERAMNELLIEVRALREAAGVPRTQVNTQQTELETNVVTPPSPPGDTASRKPRYPDSGSIIWLSTAGLAVAGFEASNVARRRRATDTAEDDESRDCVTVRADLMAAIVEMLDRHRHDRV